MSCNCNNPWHYPWCPSFLAPADPCPDGPSCDEQISSDCVIYTGPDLECYGITTGMTVTEILLLILQHINPQCTTTTSTTTTTTIPPTTTTTTLVDCQCVNFTNTNESDSQGVSYVNCAGEGQVVVIDPSVTISVCMRMAVTPVVGPDITISYCEIACTDDETCGACTTTTTIPVTTTTTLI
jgi:hypothetical protein